MQRLAPSCLLPLVLLCACRTSKPAPAQQPGVQPKAQPHASVPAQLPGSAPLPEAARQSAAKPTPPVQPTHAYLLELRQRRAAETDPSRRAEFDLESARVLWQLEGPGPARGLYEQVAADATPAIALQSRIARAYLGAMELEQGRAGAAREQFRKALVREGRPEQAGSTTPAALPGELEWIMRANLALCEAMLAPSAANLMALEAATVDLERAGLLEEAQAMRRNRERLGKRKGTIPLRK